MSMADNSENGNHGQSITLPSHNIITPNKQNSSGPAPLAANNNLIPTSIENSNTPNSVTSPNCISSSVIASADSLNLSSQYIGSNSDNIGFGVKEMASNSMSSLHSGTNSMRENANHVLSPPGSNSLDLRGLKESNHQSNHNNAASPSFNTMSHSFKDLGHSLAGMSSGSNSLHDPKDLHDAGPLSPSSMTHRQFNRHLDLGPPVLTHASNFINHYSSRHLGHGGNSMQHGSSSLSHGSGMGHASSPMGHNSNSMGYGSNSGHAGSPMGHSPSYMGHSAKQLAHGVNSMGSGGSMSPRPMSAGTNFLSSNYMSHGGGSMLQQQGTNSMVPGDHPMAHGGGGSMGACAYPISSGVAPGVGPL